jgi:uncharacterized protein
MNILENPHIQTILPALFRSKPKLSLLRKIIITNDDDFLDLDYYEPNSNSNKIAILIHGLEGSSQDHYILSTALRLSKLGINSLCLNLRSCSGRPNNLINSYHSGKIEDLELTLSSIDNRYKEIYLIGFSVGGNIVLKYLGERASAIDSRIKKAFAISPPLDLQSSAEALSKPVAKIYMSKLLYNLRKKIKEKMKIYPMQIGDAGFSTIKNFYDFDSRYTAPLNGFLSAPDYWSKASSKNHLEQICVDTTILSSLDDPFLGHECFPELKNSFVKTIYTQIGGHLGFFKLDWRQSRIDFLYEEMLDEW